MFKNISVEINGISMWDEFFWGGNKIKFGCCFYFVYFCIIELVIFKLKCVFCWGWYMCILFMNCVYIIKFRKMYEFWVMIYGVKFFGKFYSKVSVFCFGK